MISKEWFVKQSNILKKAEEDIRSEAENTADQILNTTFRGAAETAASLGKREFKIVLFGHTPEVIRLVPSKATRLGFRFSKIEDGHILHFYFPSFNAPTTHS